MSFYHLILVNIKVIKGISFLYGVLKALTLDVELEV